MPMSIRMSSEEELVEEGWFSDEELFEEGVLDSAHWPNLSRPSNRTSLMEAKTQRNKMKKKEESIKLRRYSGLPALFMIPVW
jgi:hypothetical protein